MLGRVCPRLVKSKISSLGGGCFLEGDSVRFHGVGGCEHSESLSLLQTHPSTVTVMWLVSSENACSMTFDRRPTATASALVR